MSTSNGDPHAPPDERGVTTAEVLVAGLLLSVGILATAQVVIGGLRASGTADRRTVAARVVDSQVERIRSLDYDTVGIDLADADAVGEFEGLTTVGSAMNPLDPVVEVAVDGTEYRVRRHVLAVPVGSDPDAYRRIVVIAGWSDDTGDHTHRVDTGLYTLEIP